MIFTSISNPHTYMNLVLDLKRRLLLLVLTFIIGYLIFGVISAIVLGRFGSDSTPAMRIVAVMQDILLFIVPALLTAVILTRRPASLLAIDRKIPSLPLLCGLGALFAAIPAMNLVIWLNQQLPLPEGMASTMQQLEYKAEDMIRALQGPHTIPNLIMSVLIVGIFAGLSEELLFRGALQRIMVTGGVGPHAAIWITGCVFSLMHMQIYGFVPRMLLGVMFGYALWWTGCLWVPVIMHIFNNTLFLVGDYLIPDINDAIPAYTVIYSMVAVISAITTLLFLRLMRRSAALETEHPAL